MSNDNNHSEQLERYLRGQMSPEEAHAFERKNLDDPFVHEATEGFERNIEGLDDLENLRKRILSKQKRKFPLLKVAAAVAMLMVGSFLVFYLVDTANDNTLLTEDLETSTMDSINLDDQELDETTNNQLAEEVKEEAKKDGLKVVQEDEAVIQSEEPLTSDSFVAEEISPILDSETDEAEIAAETNTQPINVEVVEDFELASADVEIQMATEVEEKNNEALAQSIQGRAAGVKINDSAIESAKLKAAVSRSATSQSGEFISGTVTDDIGEPLPGVNVVIKGTTTGVVTDVDGNYQLPKIENSTLIYSFVGFETSELEVGDRTNIDVSLGGSTELQEVVVTGYGATDEDRSYSPASPENGSRAFKKYLDENIRYPEAARNNEIKGTVILEVRISASGAIDSINIKKSLGFGCDQEAIRLVKEGPKWTPATLGNTQVADEVRVRVKFKID